MRLPVARPGPPAARVSCAVHVFNEAEATVRLLRSSLPLAHLIGEWVVLDHRSDDGLAAALDAVEPELVAQGVTLTRLYEGRDLSRDHTFADVRTRTVKACRHPVVALLDADFLLGPAFGDWLRLAVPLLSNPGSRVHGCRYAVPCVWDELQTDEAGRITKHGRVWVHNRRIRIMWRDAVRYEQRGDGGRWEYLNVEDPRRPQEFHLTPLGTRQQKVRANAVVSVNVKPAERIALRDTMTMFMQDAISGGQEGTWLENYAAGRVRNQPPYPFHQVRLTGWRLHAPNLRLTSGSLARA